MWRALALGRHCACFYGREGGTLLLSLRWCRNGQLGYSTAFFEIGFRIGFGNFGPENLFKPYLKLISRVPEIGFEQAFASKLPQTLSKTLLTRDQNDTDHDHMLRRVLPRKNMVSKRLGPCHFRGSAAKTTRTKPRTDHLFAGEGAAQHMVMVRVFLVTGEGGARCHARGRAYEEPVSQSLALQEDPLLE